MARKGGRRRQSGRARVVEEPGRLTRRKWRADRSRDLNRTALKAMSDPSRGWYLGWLKRGCELTYHGAIVDLGVTAYLPLRTDWRGVNGARGRRDAKTRHTFAAIPGLVFIAPPQPVDWLALGESGALHGVLYSCGLPHRFLGSEILRWVRLNANVFDAPDEARGMITKAEYGVGDRCRLISGPLEGWEVRVDQIDAREAHFTINMFGFPQNVGVPLDHLERVA